MKNKDTYGKSPHDPVPHPIQFPGAGLFYPHRHLLYIKELLLFFLPVLGHGIIQHGLLVGQHTIVFFLRTDNKLVKLALAGTGGNQVAADNVLLHAFPCPPCH